MATIVELLKEKTIFFRRWGWGPGEFVHTDAMVMNNDTDLIEAAQVCFCHAPVHGNMPEAEDDCWEAYVGKETEDVEHIEVKPMPAVLMEVLAEGLLRARRKRHRDEVRKHAPDVPATHVGPTMRG